MPVLSPDVIQAEARAHLKSPARRHRHATGAGLAAARGMAQASWLGAEDIARSIAFMVTQPAHAAINAINAIMVRPTAQEH